MAKRVTSAASSSICFALMPQSAKAASTPAAFLPLPLIPTAKPSSGFAQFDAIALSRLPAKARHRFDDRNRTHRHWRGDNSPFRKENASLAVNVIRPAFRHRKGENNGRLSPIKTPAIAGVFPFNCNYQLFSATSTSSSIFFASPNNMRLFSL